MAACTSRAAASMLRLRSNWSTTVLAPSRTAWTWITGNSTWGRGATGSCRYAMMPARSSPTARSEVPMGRLMKGAEMFTRLVRHGRRRQRAGRGRATEAPREPVEVEIHDGRGVEGQHLGEEEAAHDGDAEGTAQLRARARAEGQGQATEERGHGRHHDGPEAEEAGLEDRLRGWLAPLALRFQGEIDHHDGVLLHDADEQDDADEGDDVEVRAEDLQSQDGPHARRGQRGQNGDGMDVALVQNA